ncbi:hypothetical protein EVAR_11256_1 [Eumeta japonica]|uniref:Uncharacterized protein n=1 Tax=Eumeta variegata TaxID=151549 RepID=A0A4C1UM20_EUMVA|nr:hypothetical protein EVAR_11256_1 [Eumeta japonica]
MRIEDPILDTKRKDCENEYTTQQRAMKPNTVRRRCPALRLSGCLFTCPCFDWRINSKPATSKVEFNPRRTRVPQSSPLKSKRSGDSPAERPRKVHSEAELELSRSPALTCARVGDEPKNHFLIDPYDSNAARAQYTEATLRACKQWKPPNVNSARDARPA